MSIQVFVTTCGLRSSWRHLWRRGTVPDLLSIILPRINQTINCVYSLRGKSLSRLGGSCKLFDTLRGVRELCQTLHCVVSAMMDRSHVWHWSLRRVWCLGACVAHSAWVRFFLCDCTYILSPNYKRLTMMYPRRMTPYFTPFLVSVSWRCSD